MSTISSETNSSSGNSGWWPSIGSVTNKAYSFASTTISVAKSVSHVFVDAVPILYKIATIAAEYVSQTAQTTPVAKQAARILYRGYLAIGSKAAKINRGVTLYIQWKSRPSEKFAEVMKSLLQKVELRKILESPPSKKKIELLNKFFENFVGKLNLPKKVKSFSINKAAASFEAKKGKKAKVTEKKVRALQYVLLNLLSELNIKKISIIVLDTLSEMIPVIHRIDEKISNSDLNAVGSKDKFRDELLNDFGISKNWPSFEAYKKYADEKIETNLSIIAREALLSDSFLGKASQNYVLNSIRKLIIFFVDKICKLVGLNIVTSFKDSLTSMIKANLTDPDTLAKIENVIGKLSKEDLELLEFKSEAYDEILFIILFERITTKMAANFENANPTDLTSIDADLNESWKRFVDAVKAPLSQAFDTVVDRQTLVKRLIGKCAGTITGISSSRGILNWLKELDPVKIISLLRDDVKDAITRISPITRAEISELFGSEISSVHIEIDEEQKKAYSSREIYKISADAANYNERNELLQRALSDHFFDMNAKAKLDKGHYVYIQIDYNKDSTIKKFTLL